MLFLFLYILQLPRCDIEFASAVFTTSRTLLLKFLLLCILQHLLRDIELSISVLPTSRALLMILFLHPYVLKYPCCDIELAFAILTISRTLLMVFCYSSMYLSIHTAILSSPSQFSQLLEPYC